MINGILLVGMQCDIGPQGQVSFCINGLHFVWNRASRTVAYKDNKCLLVLLASTLLGVKQAEQ